MHGKLYMRDAQGKTIKTIVVDEMDGLKREDPADDGAVIQTV